MSVFIIIALVATLLHTVLLVFVDIIGSAIAFAIAGFSCGLVLRTRLSGGVKRMLVPIFFAIGFAVAGERTLLLLLSEAPLGVLIGVHALFWAVPAALASLPYLRLAVPLFAFACFGATGALAALLLEWFGPLGIFFVHPMLACLAAGVFDQLCARIGLESPEEEFDRLRMNVEFRLK